jgi:hypothetical protein
MVERLLGPSLPENDQAEVMKAVGVVRKVVKDLAVDLFRPGQVAAPLLLARERERLVRAHRSLLGRAAPRRCRPVTFALLFLAHVRTRRRPTPRRPETP